MPSDHLRAGQFCFDACYNPRRTRFLLDAQQAGATVMNGLYMSLYQGVRQFELWTGKKAPIDLMKRELETAVAEMRS